MLNKKQKTKGGCAVALVLSLLILGGCSGTGVGGGGGGGPNRSSGSDNNAISTAPATGPSAGAVSSYPVLPSSLPAASGSYLANPGLEATNYRYAHAAGVEGAGVTVAVVDSGVAQHTKFDSRLLAGLDVVGGSLAGKEDGTGHGTHVAGLIAAAVAGAGPVGMAPSANIVPIRVMDSAGVGTSATLKAGVEGSAALNAKIYNISLGTSPNTDVDTALTWLKDNGKLAIVAAGNAGAATPGYPASSAPAMAGQLIAVGSIESDGSMSTYSNRAGAAAKNFFMVAPGSNLVSLNGTAGTTVKSGSSMAAAVVSGAAALVWGYWPYLRADQVADILLVSAKDLGAAGVDDIYGRGALDVKAALSPVGTLALTTSQGQTVVAGQSLVKVSGAAAQALQASSVAPVYFDSYKRAFSLPLSYSVAVAKEDSLQSVGQGLGQLLQAADPSRRPTSGMDLRVSQTQNALTGSVSSTYGFELSTQSGTTTLFEGARYLPFDQGGLFQGRASFAQSSALKNPYLAWASSPQGMSFSTGLSGGLLTFGSVTGKDALGEQLTTQLAEMRWGDASLSQVSVQAGAQSGRAAFAGIAAAGAAGSTNFVSVSGTVQTGYNTWLMASATTGYSRVQGNDVLTQGDAVTQAWSVGLVQEAAFTSKGRLGLSLTLPNRIERGSATLNLPVGVTSTGQAVYSDTQVSLAPQGRESVLELAWSTPVKNGAVGFSIARRFQPNHDLMAAPEDLLAVRWQHWF